MNRIYLWVGLIGSAISAIAYGFVLCAEFEWFRDLTGSIIPWNDRGENE